MGKQATQKRNNTGSHLDAVYYTDPLCCWSWAFEPVIQRLLNEYGEQLSVRYCMGGMLSGWDNYHDTLHAVSRPIQMGPVWMQARQLSGCELNDTIWFTDPPASSYPACVAVKCAALQSEQLAAQYLLKLRMAVMLQAKNIAKKEVLIAAAGELASENSLFDLNKFTQQLTSQQVINAFRADMQEAKYRGIRRFPSLLLQVRNTKKSLLLTGNRPFEAVASCITQLVSG
ncbi:DsbA family protein [Chitinophaga sp.]|uniref:DsbA family protein n=1 Tax=Chitinophaga sp. TaxID=1869181 RepID=UPI002CC6D976|nr:DsbA family protein [Chitinophaga sp.]HWV68313.1 DsbA family protein [Chitinophaga sp.]